MEILQIAGRPVLFHRNDSNVVNVRCIVSAGSKHEKDDEYGLAHFLEHMFFKGTEQRSYKEINKLTSKLGGINAYTYYDKTVFYVSTNLRGDNFEQAADVLAEMIFQPAFIQEEFEKERAVIIEEYQARKDDPYAYFFDQIPQNFMGKLLHSIVGKKEIIETAGIDKLMEFRNRYYPGVLFSVCGNIDEYKAVSVMANVLSRYSGYIDIDFDPVEPPVFNFNDLQLNHPAKQAVIAFCLKGNGMQQVIENNYADLLLANVLGGGMHSLLFDRIREELGLCYSVGIHIQKGRDNSGFVVYCMLDKKNIELAKKEITGILNTVAEKGVSEELIEIGKSNILFSKAAGMETSAGFSNSVFDQYYISGNRLVGYDEIEKKVDTLTNADIIKVAQELLGHGMKYCEMTEKQNGKR